MASYFVSNLLATIHVRLVLGAPIIALVLELEFFNRIGRKPKFKLRHYQSCARVEPYYNCAKISSLISAFE